MNLVICKIFVSKIIFNGFFYGIRLEKHDFSQIWQKSTIFDLPPDISEGGFFLVLF